MKKTIRPEKSPIIQKEVQIENVPVHYTFNVQCRSWCCFTSFFVTEFDVAFF